MLKGIGASPGIAVSKVLIKKNPEINIRKYKIAKTKDELERLDRAIEKARLQIELLYDKTLENLGEDEAGIFHAHLMMLDDPEVFGQVRDKIEKETVNAEWAISQVTNGFVSIFESMDNEYLRERAADLVDVTNRVLRILLNIDIEDLSKIDEDVIIIAEDIAPSDTAQMNKERVLGFVAEIGGKTAHSAIMARTLEIPAVLGIKDILDKVTDGDMIAINGEDGTVIINPDEETLTEIIRAKEDQILIKERLSSLKGQESITKDGFKVELAANIGTPKDIEAIIRNDGEGVGLYRTEFLYMDRDQLPTEEEQFQAYKMVAESLDNKAVIIRTLDIGGDKEILYMDLPKEMNPFLGYRAIRLCLDRKDIFKTQLRAILRASAYGNIKIMYPMVSSIEELREANKLLNEAKVQLDAENISYNKDLEVGIMVEVPSVAIISDLFAREVDFFSIGTNDLIQYTTAVDRGNRQIVHLYNQFHPAILRLIKLTIDNGHKEGIWIGMCGEAAGDPKLIPILIGMGLDEFSMSPMSILKARWIVRNTSKKDMEIHVEKLINMLTAEEVENYIDENINIEF